MARATSPQLVVDLTPPALAKTAERAVRADGQPVLIPHASARYTTEAILRAEADLLTSATTVTPHTVPAPVLVAVLTARQHTGQQLDPGQAALVRAFTTDARQLLVGIGPAGAGKTTALAAAAAVWAAAGRQVVALATSARAAQVLGEDLGGPAQNLHKYLHDTARTELTGAPADGPFRPLRPGDVVLLDEAGMAGTADLHTLLRHVQHAGALLRLVGDPAQLAAIDAGGALRLLTRDVGAVHLTGLHRFGDPAEAAATLQLRAGDPAGLDFYFAHGRVRDGSREAMLEAAYTAWRADLHTGWRSVLIAANTTDVTALNVRARLERISTGQVQPGGVELADTSTAGVGDWIVTRRNDRRLTTTGPKSRWAARHQRRHLDRHRRAPRRQPHRGPPPARRAGGAARRLRRHPGRARLRHHHPPRPTRHRGHRARPGRRVEHPRAALRRRDPRPAPHHPLPHHRRPARPAPRPHPRSPARPDPARHPHLRPAQQRRGSLRHRNPARRAQRHNQARLATALRRASAAQHTANWSTALARRQRRALVNRTRFRVTALRLTHLSHRPGKSRPPAASRCSHSRSSRASGTPRPVCGTRRPALVSSSPSAASLSSAGIHGPASGWTDSRPGRGSGRRRHRGREDPHPRGQTLGASAQYDPGRHHDRVRVAAPRRSRGEFVAHLVAATHAVSSTARSRVPRARLA